MISGHWFIEGTIECVTGIHIGAASETIEIGGIDSPVIRHPVTGAPYIPGSSLKGKMRSLLERETKNESEFKRDGGGGTKRHECETRKNAEECDVCRVFGSTGDKNNPGDNHPALLIVRDCLLSTGEKGERFIHKDGLWLTEAKMENTLDRMTAKANPRTIERVPSETEFDLGMVYQVGDETKVNLKEDLTNILKMMQHIEERDGLGGNVSRGYGQVKFKFQRCERVDVSGGRAGLARKDKTEYTYEQCLAEIDETLSQD